jgi:phosphatidylserine/phosphatidylglycerophosphate/cardiolipin synthase-like enzyme
MRAALVVVALCSALLFSSSVVQAYPARERARTSRPTRSEPRAGALTVLPDDGRKLYFQAIDAAKHEIRIEICVLEDPQILEHLQVALNRGLTVRAIVDRGKYLALASESANLAHYFTASGGALHLSNPTFPRSFPKIILIDSRMFIYGSACLDETTFLQYRDFAQVATDPTIVRALHDLFETDWTASAAPGQEPSAFNPTPPIPGNDLIVAPVNATARLVGLYQQARKTLDVYTELVGNPTLEAELVAAVGRGVRVRLIAPALVNGATPDAQQLQDSSLAALATAGVHVHVSGPEQNAQLPYMHARATVVDGQVAYLGSISLSPDSATQNREMGLIQRQTYAVRKLSAQFESDFASRTKTLSPVGLAAAHH